MSPQVITGHGVFAPDALYGKSDNPNVPGVHGEHGGGGPGVLGESGSSKGFLGGVDPQFHQNAGVYGESGQQGVLGHATNDTGTGVFGNSKGGGFGVRGESGGGIAVQGQSFGDGIGVLGKGGRVAGRFEGDVEVTGDIRLVNGRFEGDVEVKGDIRLVNADCAEDFDVSGTEEIEAGTVMVIDQDGALRQSRKAHDKRVAGVVSGAGDCKPAIILGKQESRNTRVPIALVGKVFCKVDAREPIEVGDLLTTSPTPGHAMKASDPLKAFGAVIGKALQPLAAGLGLIPILVALQ